MECPPDLPVFDIEAGPGLKLIAPRKLLQHSGIILRVITCNMADLQWAQKPLQCLRVLD